MAEYEALVRGLKKSIDMKVKCLEVFQLFNKISIYKYFFYNLGCLEVCIIFI